MKAQAVAIDQPYHSVYEKFIEITNSLRGAALSAGTPSGVETYLEEDGRELRRSLLQEHFTLIIAGKRTLRNRVPVKRYLPAWLLERRAGATERTETRDGIYPSEFRMEALFPLAVSAGVLYLDNFVSLKNPLLIGMRTDSAIFAHAHEALMAAPGKHRAGHGTMKIGRNR